MDRAEPPVRLIQSGRFFLPGPTEVHPDVLAAQTRPMISHRGPEMEALLGRVQPGLGGVLGTSRPVVVSTSSATGLMEAALRSTDATDVLCLVGGAFGQRFSSIARRSGRSVHELAVEWGHPHSVEALVTALSRTRADVVTMVHNETSTGTLNPVGDLARAVRRHSDALVVIDSVSGAGGVEVEAEAWGADVLLTGSQKALALPPGLAFAAVSRRFLERARTAESPGFYFDLASHVDRAGRRQTTTTPAISTLFALDVQIERIRAEGMGARAERHRRMARRCHDWVERAGERGRSLTILAREGARSPTVTTVQLPEGLSAQSIAEGARARGFVVGTGYGDRQEKELRIGHMGDHTEEGLQALLDTLDEVLAAPP